MIVPTVPQPDLDKSDAFAIVLPLSKLSEKALKSVSRNRVLLDNATTYQQHLKHLKSNIRTVAKLDFLSIIGRRSLTFGCSRRARFQLSQHQGVSPLHFRLHLDATTGTLVFTDISQAGTWIVCQAGRKLVHNDVHRFEEEDNIRIQLGQNAEMEFDIALGDGMRDVNRRKHVFDEYIQSTNSTCSKISGSGPVEKIVRKRKASHHFEDKEDTMKRKIPHLVNTKDSSRGVGYHVVLAPADERYAFRNSLPNVHTRPIQTSGPAKMDSDSAPTGISTIDTSERSLEETIPYSLCDRDRSATFVQSWPPTEINVIVAGTPSAVMPCHYQ